MAQETEAKMREWDFREDTDVASTQIFLEKLTKLTGIGMLSAPIVHKDHKLYLQGLISQAICGASASLEHEP